MKNLLFIFAVTMVFSTSLTGARILKEENRSALVNPLLNQQAFMEEIYYECEFIPEFPLYCIMLA